VTRRSASTCSTTTCDLPPCKEEEGAKELEKKLEKSMLKKKAREVLVGSVLEQKRAREELKRANRRAKENLTARSDFDPHTQKSFAFFFQVRTGKEGIESLHARTSIHTHKSPLHSFFRPGQVKKELSHCMRVLQSTHTKVLCILFSGPDR
jgi:hypothetical protein